MDWKCHLWQNRFNPLDSYKCWYWGFTLINKLIRNDIDTIDIERKSDELDFNCMKNILHFETQKIYFIKWAHNYNVKRNQPLFNSKLKGDCILLLHTFDPKTKSSICSRLAGHVRSYCSTLRRLIAISGINSTPSPLAGWVVCHCIIMSPYRRPYKIFSARTVLKSVISRKRHYNDR